MDLVDEQKDVAAALDLLEHLLEALLEVAAVAAAGDEGAEVEGVQLLAAQRVGDVAVDDHLGEALDDGGLADTGLADEHRVVLRPAGQDLHDPLDFTAATDHRVELVLAGKLVKLRPNWSRIWLLLPFSPPVSSLDEPPTAAVDSAAPSERPPEP